MPTVQSEQLTDFTASDLLSPSLWQPQAKRPPLGIDITCTKVAVDFQNLTAASADAVIRQNLEVLREATGTDVVFLALLDGNGGQIDSVACSRNLFSGCRPEVLKGDSLESLPWIRSRLEHVRIIEFPTPGNGFGDAGEGYVRFALTAPVERIQEAVERIKNIL